MPSVHSEEVPMCSQSNCHRNARMYPASMSLKCSEVFSIHFKGLPKFALRLSYRDAEMYPSFSGEPSVNVTEKMRVPGVIITELLCFVPHSCHSNAFMCSSYSECRGVPSVHVKQIPRFTLRPRHNLCPASVSQKSRGV